jgi:hypothetical protein
VKILRIFFVVLCLSAADAVEAYPLLQLDILGGHYDASTQTIVSDGPNFTLVALLTPKNNSSVESLLNDTYYISAAISPNVSEPGADLGTFSWNSTSYDVTGDMTYGTPPVEGSGLATGDPGDLAPHSIFPTYFREFEFQFSPTATTVSYNSQDDPGGLTPTSSTTGISYYATFNVTTELTGSNVVHFDLYDTLLRNCARTRTCTPDEDIEHFAPFSHDAESSNTHSVPEPQSLLLVSAGMLLASRALKRTER